MKYFLIILSFALILSCQARKKDKTLSLALTSELSTFDPAISYDNVSGSVLYNIFEQLYEYHYLNRPYELRPLLADGMPIIENNGKKYTIKIKKNIQYHAHPAFKGKPRFVIASDFILAFKRLAFAPLNSTGWFTVDGMIEGINDFRKSVGNNHDKMLTTPIAGISAPDDSTLVINITSPSPQFIYRLALSFLSPIPEEVLAFEKEKFGLHPVGTGPFFVAEQEKNKDILLKRFLPYREVSYPSEGDRMANIRGLLKDAGEKIPFIDQLHFKVVPDNKIRWEKFLNHELDLIALPQDFYHQIFDEVGNLKEGIKAKNIHLQTVPTLTYWWVAFNMRDPLLGKNLNLRKAIAFATNMDHYISKFTFNTGQRANSILPPGIFGYDPNSTLPYHYDLTKAKEFLALAGYPNGKNLPALNYDTRSEVSISMDQANFFKEELAQIGIKVNIIKNSFNQFLEKSRTGRLQFFQDGWTLDYPDSENVYQLLITNSFPPGPNASFFSNKELNNLYEKMSRLPDSDEKKEILKRMEQIVTNEIPWVMQYYSRNFILYHDDVKNFRASDLIWSFPKYLKISPP